MPMAWGHWFIDPTQYELFATTGLTATRPRSGDRPFIECKAKVLPFITLFTPLIPSFVKVE
jgi:hypothetical protein